MFASTSITMMDFNAGVNAAATKIDFTEQRQSLGNAAVLATFLRQLDAAQYDVIALIRGGGSGIEALDEIEVLKAVSEMKTPVICAIGHVGEELFMKSIADKVAPTPNGLGQYFSEMVEKVTAKRNNSRAALVEEVRKQFIKQIDESNKKNKDLLEQVTKLNKQAEEQRKTNTENLKKLQEENAKAQQKQQEENKKNLETQQKKNEEALAKLQADNKKNLKTVQAQAKQQMDAANKLNGELQKQLKSLNAQQKQQFDRMTEQNKMIQSKLEKEQQRSHLLETQLAGRKNQTTILLVVAIIALIVGFVLSKLIS